MEALRAAGCERTLEGARECLREWVGTMKPEYMMASTPAGFKWGADGEELPAAKNSKGVDESDLKVVGAFAASASLTSSGGGCCDESGGASTSPTLNNEASLSKEASDLLSSVLIPVCEELDLTIARAALIRPSWRRATGSKLPPPPLSSACAGDSRR